MKCELHGHAFTLYPVGHYPYGRKAMAPVDAMGRLLRQAEEEPPSVLEPTTAPGRPATGGARLGDLEPAWSVTWFCAALDGAAGRAWSREEPPPVGEPGRWPTQQRWLERGARQLGLSADIEPGVRQRVAERLSVPYLALRQFSRQYAAGCGYRGCSAAVVALLRHLPVRPGLVDDLIACGYLTGLWGRPSRFDPGGGDRSVRRPRF